MKIEYQIVFLGSAGGRYVTANQLRASGGMILLFEGAQFHVDPGPGSLVMARRLGINLRDNNVVLVTHNHLDHCNDVNVVIDAMTYGGLDKAGLLLASKSVIYGDEKERPYLSKFYRNCIERYFALEAGKEVKVNNMKIVATKTKHSDETGIGFKFFTKKFVLGFTGDTNYFPELIDEFKGCNILLINNQRSFTAKRGGPLSSKDSVTLINGIKPNLAILTHFGKKILKDNPIYEAREIQRRTGVQTIASRDGMAVDLLSYSTSLRQKTLHLY